ncbi:MAG: KpsF/GutQ family sugar-phosphate isomerase [Deltaproteobacteria bacterium]
MNKPKANIASDALASARRVIGLEATALAAMAERLGEPFAAAVETIAAIDGRVVVTGMGKSGQVCKKIAATLSSTGTAAVFLHAAEAAHGDLGMFARGDVCLAVSNSGTTQEILELLPAVRRLSLPLVAMTGGLDSPLAVEADFVLDVSVAEEACPLGLAPTASTTATLAMGDALAVAVLERRGFDEQDFAMLHPGGALGRQLLRIAELMHGQDELPVVGPDEPAHSTLEAMTAGGLGVVAVVDQGRLAGVVTDGDVRRALLAHTGKDAFDSLSAAGIMSSDPKTVAAEALATEALALMEEHAITSLFITDKEGRPCGILHMHDLLRAGLA